MAEASHSDVFSVDTWLQALLRRHAGAMTRPEFLKAIRALSARYVERRADLPDRSPLDSAGKRAAFAAFYAPMHFLTTREIVRRLGASHSGIDVVTDLGCGTGVAGAAWALETGGRPALHGVDLNAWAVAEARWNWREMHVGGRVLRDDLCRAVEALVRPAAAKRPPSLGRTGVVMGWSMNELDPAARERAQTALLDLAACGARVIVIEPIARRLVPWWDRWTERAASAGGRADEWRFDAPLPAALAELDEAAGFDREALTARSVVL